MLFEFGKFILSSGITTNWRINAEYLTDKDLRTCAYLLSLIVPPFSEVEGVPTGGLKLAEYMEPLKTKNSKQLLIVDDVWTTGGSWNKHRNNRNAIGAVIFARGEVPDNIISLWTLNNKIS